MTQFADAHETVLLNEAVDALQIKPDGVYFDGTFGRGGHSALIMSRLGPQGRLLTTDKDPQALAVAAERFADDERFVIQRGSFTTMSSMAQMCGRNGKLDGLLLDLGVSSPQLDEAARGFSFMREGPLDMRMDPEAGEPVSGWLNRADEKDIADVLYQYGEEKQSRRIARAIAQRRIEEPLRTTTQLAEWIKQVMPRQKKGDKHPATRSFQALRIFINDELGDLQDVLMQIPGVLAGEGRAAIISFHSLEDRMVKRFFRDQEQGPRLPRRLPVMQQNASVLKTVGKVIKATPEEIERNARSRSAVMRIAERCGE